MISVAQPVVILGGGLAGLTAATYLRRHGVLIRLFEAGKVLAGLARSERDDEGYTYDFGAHFITNRVAASVGCSASCRMMPRYGETVLLRNRGYSYPMGLMRRPRFVAGAIRSRLGGLVRRRARTAEEWYRRAYGRSLADQVAIPLVEAWSGVPASELSSAVGEKFATGLPRTLMLKAAARITRRTVAIGYSGTVTESPHVWHVYPDGGIGTVCEALADEVRDAIQLESPVEAILVEGERVVGVQVAGQALAASAVISTAPVHVLPRLVKGSDRLAYLSRFQYRPMVFVNVKLDGPSGLPDVVTWTPEKSVPFFRLSDIGAGLPWLVPPGKSLVTCDIGCTLGDNIWTMNEDELGRLCVQGLETLVPGTAARYLGCRVMRTPLAYPVYRQDYEEDRLRFEQGTGIEGLYSIGRNGEFAHILMEDIFWRTRRKLLPLIDQWQAAEAGSTGGAITMSAHRAGRSREPQR